MGSAEVIVELHLNPTSPSVLSRILPLPFLGVHPKGMPTSGAVQSDS